VGDVAPNEDEQQADVQPDRRQFLGKAALGAAGAGIVWAAPQVISMQAAAAATHVPPSLLTTQNNRNTGTSATVGGLGNPGANAQILVVYIPVAAGANGLTVTPSPGTGPAWVPLITAYNSSTTTPGTTSPDGSADRLVMYAWTRIGAITANEGVTVTVTGTGLRPSPQDVWRAIVAEFAGATAIANNPNEGLAQGGGLANVTNVPGPQIANNGFTTLAFYFGGTDFSGSNNPNSLPSGYFFADGNASQPAHMVGFKSVAATDPIPAVTGSFLSGGHVVGLQVTVEGT